MNATLRVSALTALATLIAMLLVPAPAHAQMDTSLIGQRVRVHVRDEFRQQVGATRLELRGTVRSADTSSLVMLLPRVTPPVTIARADIIRLDVSRGVPGRFQSALQGLVGGAVVGAMWGAVYYWFDAGPDHTPLEDALGVGALIGAGVGTVSGAIWPVERWRRVRLR